eukprot:TRINITY_DN7665_c0_g2_i2.p1 TRINITY_DN7665_c0_g2~~TRINITY_DN7665_c0_g2_i2.p1  ORF type:complete len:791 (-),score=104.42 TRINITY_DN7665_c0_g2_i2:155-2491(-)
MHPSAKGTLLLLLLLWRSHVAQGGFCLNLTHPLLVDTGFAAVNDLDEARCRASGFEWCPLVNETETWTENGISVEYFWFSPCCTGEQNVTLKVDDRDSYPTCRKGVPRRKCKRSDWLSKLMSDLVDKPSHEKLSPYEMLVPPSDLEMDASVNATPRPPPACICKPTDPECEMTSGDGAKCLICKTDRKCGGNVISLGLNIFKIESVDLRSSQLTLSTWLRTSWTDERLSFHKQCYGGVDTLDIQAKAGDLEQSKIWVPDLELYNSRDNIWDGSFPARLASIYACSSPARSSCGSVWWSRPGIISALCMYEGLVMFPFDILKCKLEIAGWSLDGRYQDIIPRAKDGGISWHNNPNAKEKAVAGLTAGGKFQNYAITDLKLERKVVFYDCCPSSPYPELIYEISFQRSSSYYVLKLIVPLLFLGVMALLTFWMPPASGERLGYGITVILAMLANDIVASELMPVCNERVFMDYLNLSAWLFGSLALLETGLVMLLYHKKCETWTEALVPTDAFRIFRSCYRRRKKERYIRRAGGSRVENLESRMKNAFSTKDSQLRRPMYKSIFWELDTNFDNELGIDEFERFWQPMFGQEWSRADAEKCLAKAGLDITLALTEAEFCYFCESSLPHKDDFEYLQQKLQFFMQLADHERNRIAAMWATRAQTIDDFAQWALPPGFVVVITWLSLCDEQTLIDLSENQSGFATTVFMGFVAFLILVLISAVISCAQSHFKQRARRLQSMKPGEPTMSWDSSDSLQIASVTSEPSPHLGERAESDDSGRCSI